jgi:uncharacterized damage-inducible protein DinB
VTLTELFIADLDREAPLTKRALEAYPDAKDDFKPHEKSMPFGRLASMIAMMPSWVAMQVEKDELDLMPPGGSGGASKFGQQFKTAAELAGACERSFAEARRVLQGTSDDHLAKNWQLKVNGQVVAEGPRHVMMRDVLMHLAHHRGQMTVYLRLCGAKVPSIYGPSADDQRF